MDVDDIEVGDLIETNIPDNKEWHDLQGTVTRVEDKFVCVQIEGKPLIYLTKEQYKKIEVVDRLPRKEKYYSSNF